MAFSRQEYWSELPFFSPGRLPNRGIEPRSPTLAANSLPSELPEKSWLVVLQEGDPFQGQKLGSCLTLRNELSEETRADKARDFIGKGHPGGGAVG